MRINYKSDFKLDLNVKFPNGDVADLSLFDFNVNIWCGEKKYAAGKTGTEYVNCKWDAELKKLTVICDNHGLLPGRLNVETRVKVPDTDFPDGSWLKVCVAYPDVHLVRGNGDDVNCDVKSIIGQAVVIAQEPGTSESKVMSQNAVTNELVYHHIPDFLTQQEMDNDGKFMSVTISSELMEQNGWTFQSLLSFFKAYKHYEMFSLLLTKNILDSAEVDSSVFLFYAAFGSYCSNFKFLFNTTNKSVVFSYCNEATLSYIEDIEPGVRDDSDLFRLTLDVPSKEEMNNAIAVGCGGADYSTTSIALPRKWIDGSVIHEKVIFIENKCLDGIGITPLTTPEEDGSVKLLLDAKMVMYPDVLQAGVIYNQVEDITTQIGDNDITQIHVYRVYDSVKGAYILYFKHNGKYDDTPGVECPYFRMYVIIQYTTENKK